MRGRPKRPDAEVPCAHCGKSVYRYPSTLNRTLCSHKCRDAVKMLQRVNPDTGEARCAKCREWKPIKDFARGIGGRPHSYCKPCSSEWLHERRGTPVEKRQAYRPEYRLTDAEKKENKRLANHLAHQARRAGGPAPHKFDIGRMFCMQDCVCCYCGANLSAGYHIDHILPVSRGGTNDLANLQLLCPRCNMKKGSMTHDEYIMSKRNRSRIIEYLRMKAEKDKREASDLLAMTLEAMA